MNTLLERGFKNPGSLDHSSFVGWMDRPLARVHVTVYQYAFKIFKEALSCCFHNLPKYRMGQANEQRNAIAKQLKESRAVNGRMKLWHYDMQTGNYLPFYEQCKPII